MKNQFTFLLLCIYQINSLFAQQTIYDTITHDDLKRAYILYIPEVYDSLEKTPLVFNFHGYTSNSIEQMNYGDFRKIADTANFIIAHPMGTLDNTNTTHWNVGWGGSTVDDVGFTSDLIDSLKSKYSIDSTRIYSTGMSNGGYMSYLLACQLSDRIAAIASVTGSMSVGTFNNCSPSHATPAMQIHGTNDPTVPYAGSGTWTRSIEQIVDYWKDYNNTKFEIVDTLPNVNPTDGSEVVHFTYSHGDSCIDVEFYKVLGGGHTWPGTSFGGVGTNYDFDASKAVWNFFSKFDINGRIENCPEEPNGTRISNLIDFELYPNPSKSVVNIQFEFIKKRTYSLFNIEGKQITIGEFKKRKNTLDLSKLHQGIYFLKVENRILKIIKK